MSNKQKKLTNKPLREDERVVSTPNQEVSEDDSYITRASKFAVVAAVSGIIGNVAHGLFVGLFES